ncbi:MAG TPA: aspartate aminotransferase family protein [Hyphomicrobiaceae bacterium]|nr:aspartate aminotransferase family protein [Hyphomicrobiaceae bacterium]
MPTYARQDIVFERGEGAWLVATSGERYLDFASGVAVNALGHAHPKLIAALVGQAEKLWHCSNLYRIAGQERLAERLCQATFADKVFFCNSGAEACEGAIKLARRYHFADGHPERWRIITFKGAFHGRTLATIAAAGNEKYLEGFGEPAPGFDIVPFGDLEAVKGAIGPGTAAIMVEPVQGEGGVRVGSNEFIKALRKLCDDNGLLLVLDEVQCGMGRTGKLFAHEWAGITPDVMAVAKGIGGGFPVGCFMATEEAAKGMVPGTHGSTYGGNPLAMAVGNTVLDAVLEPGFLEHVHKMGLRLKQELARVKDENPGVVEEVRGSGLLAGIKVKPPMGEVVAACTAEKLLTVGAGENVVRLLPPLNVTEAEIAEAVNRLSAALKRVAVRPVA